MAAKNTEKAKKAMLVTECVCGPEASRVVEWTGGGRIYTEPGRVAWLDSKNTAFFASFDSGNF